MTNVSDILNYAEYFLLPSLKCLCVHFINTAKVSDDNFMTLLHLSSLYNFDVSSCYDYVKGNMDKCFENQDFLSVKKESLKYLLSDEKLSYVSADARFTFLLKWAKHRGIRYVPDMLEILSTVDLNDVTPRLVKEAKYDSLFKDCQMVFNVPLTHYKNPKRLVFIQKTLSDSADFRVFDIDSNTWYRLDVHSLRDTYCENFFSKSVSDSVLYSIKSTNSATSLFIHDIEKGTRTTTNLVIKSDVPDWSLSMKQLDDSFITFSGENVYAVVAKSNMELLPKFNLDTRLKLPNRFEPSVPEFHQRSLFNSQYVTVLYEGEINSIGEETEMKPVVSILCRVRSGFCADKNKTIALFDKDYKLHIYDTIDRKLDKISLGFNYADKVYPAEEGFVVSDRNRIVCITRNEGTSETQRYQTLEIGLNRSLLNNRFYNFVGHMWIRSQYPNCVLNGEECEYTFHKDLLSRKSFDKTNWVSIPSFVSRDCYSHSERVAMISLPRYLLKCHIECPHCDRIKRETSEQNRSFSENESNVASYDMEYDNVCYYDDYFLDYDCYV